jgi:hypothetical protein
MPSTLADADVTDSAGLKALSAFAKNRAVKAKLQALQFLENLQGHRATTEQGHGVPMAARPLSDPTAAGLLQVFAASVGVHCFGQLHKQAITIWRQMAMYPSTYFEAWLSAERHAHLSAQLVTMISEGTLRPRDGGCERCNQTGSQ